MEGSAAEEQQTQDQDQQQTQGTEQNQSTDQEGSGQTTSSERDPQTGGQTTFRNPMLAGKTPQEIERLFGIYEGTVREQGSQLNEMQRRLSSVEERVVQEEDEDLDFFENPREAIRREMREMMAPFMEDLRERKELSAREQLRQKYDDWNEVEQYVDMLLSQQGVDPNHRNNVGVLETAYWTIQGMKSKGLLGSNDQGNMNQSPAQQQPPQRQQGNQQQAPSAPPQHRPSNAPVSTPQSSGGKKLRDLTENERRLAREYGMSHEEYLRWQDMNAEDVAKVEESNDG